MAADTIGAPMTLAQLMQRFRGESVTLVRSASEVKGIIYGVENRTEDDQVVETVVLINEQGLQSVALSTVDRVQFEKEELRTELGQAMSGLVKSRKANQKKLDLLLEGTGNRDVGFAYVIDMPIWRMTYRMAIKDDKVMLQGWAHVDNVTGVDWKDVTMELRSGRPQAFHANVFAPLMSQRPSVGNSVFDFAKGVVLVTQWFGYQPDDRYDAGGGMGGGGQGGGGFGGGTPFGGASRPSEGIDIDSAFRESAQAGSTSQMVRYIIDKPVNLDAGRSAALPVFGQELPARILTICDDEDDSLPPMHAIEFTNRTGLAMVSGPLSVMRDGDFVGDGQLERLAVDQQTEVVYGFDRAVRQSRVDEDQETKLESMAIRDGNVIISGRSIDKQIYTIENDDTEPRNVVLYCQGSDIKEARVSPEPDRIEGNRLRFVIPVEAKSSKKHQVVIEIDFTQKTLLSSVTKSEVDKWLKAGVIIPDVDQAYFARLFEIDKKIQGIRNEKSKLTQRRATLLSEQARMRENVQALEGNPEAAKSFVDKLLKMESELDEWVGLDADVDEQLRKAEAERLAEARNYGR